MLELWCRRRCRTHADNIRRVPEVRKRSRTLLFSPTTISVIGMLPYQVFDIDTIANRLFARFPKLGVV